MAAKVKFTLNRVEKDSSLWRKLVDHFSDSIEDRRDRLENSDDEILSTKLRGEIAAFRELIDLGVDRG